MRSRSPLLALTPLHREPRQRRRARAPRRAPVAGVGTWRVATPSWARGPSLWPLPTLNAPLGGANAHLLRLSAPAAPQRHTPRARSSPRARVTPATRARQRSPVGVGGGAGGAGKGGGLAAGRRRARLSRALWRTASPRPRSPPRDRPQLRFATQTPTQQKTKKHNPTNSSIVTLFSHSLQTLSGTVQRRGCEQTCVFRRIN